MKSKIYLASPYTHDSPEIRASRVNFASRIAASLMEDYAVFSPITHGHHIADYLPTKLAASHQFWMEQCFPLLEACDMLLVLPQKGWIVSRGVEEELNFAYSRKIPTLLYESPFHHEELHPITPDDRRIFPSIFKGKL